MSKICCFTGHRDMSARDFRELPEKLDKLVAELVENEGVTDFRAGGARGFDSLAAIAVIKLKKTYPEVKLHLILPCKNQESRYSPLEKKLYNFTLHNADSVYYIQERYSNGVMFARNRALVDGSDICAAFMTRLRGGTYQTVNYARKKGIKLINLVTYK